MVVPRMCYIPFWALNFVTPIMMSYLEGAITSLNRWHLCMGMLLKLVILFNRWQLWQSELSEYLQFIYPVSMNNHHNSSHLNFCYFLHLIVTTYAIIAGNTCTKLGLHMYRAINSPTSEGRLLLFGTFSRLSRLLIFFTLLSGHDRIFCLK